jgi:hypothetical protein
MITAKISFLYCGIFYRHDQKETGRTVYTEGIELCLVLVYAMYSTCGDLRTVFCTVYTVI